MTTRAINELLDEVIAKHHPLPAASPAAISRAEARVGCQLPADLKRFYARCGGAQLFREEDAPYEILEPDLVRSVSLDVLGPDCPADELPPPSWFSLCYVQDSNYVAIDLPPTPSGEVWFIDCFHETIGLKDESAIIALSFTEFLERALASEGRHYWLGEHPSYGDAFQRPRG